ncbi:MAG: serine/threonine-protein kinase [Verrucomicrobiales bacterium]
MSKPSPSLDEIYLEAREISDAPARASYLADACGDDADLRRRIEGMLHDAAQAQDFFEALDRAATGSRGEIEQAGTMIGRYKLLEKIGEGGMGVVYMATQEEPVRRQVALKIIKPSMDTSQVVARFEAERQALALMDHPSIAQVLDGGTTNSGRPYLVMELVQGVPITEFCVRNALSVKERLALFIPVCQAIQSAHQKGIIHRDIKPSNVLVTMHNGAPHPMVIDFGVAKAVSQKLTEKTFFTHFATMIGTPAYMSPEQAEISQLDADTRSDIYSARSAALRTTDRHHSISRESTAERRLSRNAAHHRRGGTRATQHAAEEDGPLWLGT